MIITESFAGPGYHLQCDENKRIKLIQNLIETYNYDITQQVIFNTNRGWTALVDLLAITNPDSKIICCVRDINWILDSMELLFRKNPFAISKMYSPDSASTVYTRADDQMTPGHTLKFAYDSLKEAITGPNQHNLILIEYDELTKHTERTMRALYKFIDQPYFDHDFSTVEANYKDYDDDANITGLHDIRRGVSYNDRKFVIPPDIQDKYKNLEVWRL